MHEPPPHRAFSAAEVVVVPPLLIRNGWLLFEIIAPHEQLSYVEDALSATGMDYEITSVTSLTDPSELLTDRQQQVVTEAITRGYYDTPRECSLTDLATTLDISTSTASDTLHRAEGHIIKEFMEAADTDTE